MGKSPLPSEEKRAPQKVPHVTYPTFTIGYARLQLEDAVCARMIATFRIEGVEHSIQLLQDWVYPPLLRDGGDLTAAAAALLGVEKVELEKAQQALLRQCESKAREYVRDYLKTHYDYTVSNWTR